MHKLVQSIFDPPALSDLVKDATKPQTPDNKLNDNYTKKEFQELCNHINQPKKERKEKPLPCGGKIKAYRWCSSGCFFGARITRSFVL